MVILEMGSHGWHLLVRYSFVENTMAGTVVPGFGGYVFGPRPN